MLYLQFMCLKFFEEITLTRISNERLRSIYYCAPRSVNNSLLFESFIDPYFKDLTRLYNFGVVFSMKLLPPVLFFTILCQTYLCTLLI